MTKRQHYHKQECAMVIPLCPEYRLTYVVFNLELPFKQGHTISGREIGISKASGAALSPNINAY